MEVRLNHLFAAAGLFGGAVLAAAAFAVPAPKSPDALLAESDIAARVRVLSVTCTKQWTDERSGEPLHAYSAELELLEIKKGDGQVGDVVKVGFEEISKGLLGPWSVFYYPGEEVWTYLVHDDGGDLYKTTWWNARGETLKDAQTKDLPTEVGKTVAIR